MIVAFSFIPVWFLSFFFLQIHDGGRPITTVTVRDGQRTCMEETISPPRSRSIPFRRRRLPGSTNDRADNERSVPERGYWSISFSFIYKYNNNTEHNHYILILFCGGTFAGRVGRWCARSSRYLRFSCVCVPCLQSMRFVTVTPYTDVACRLWTDGRPVRRVGYPLISDRIALFRVSRSPWFPRVLTTAESSSPGRPVVTCFRSFRVIFVHPAPSVSIGRVDYRRSRESPSPVTIVFVRLMRTRTSFYSYEP